MAGNCPHTLVKMIILGALKSAVYHVLSNNLQAWILVDDQSHLYMLVLSHADTIMPVSWIRIDSNWP